MGGGGALVVRLKFAEGITDAKNRRFVLYIPFSGKSGGLVGGGAVASVKATI